ncbi:MAG TPA: polyprenol monophosphomannose synthase [Acidimicrobiales bacterium]|jgi:glycosyltransferase involved in cell wall biosynthesis|nr:polyprenol monophosphomannose synthase [Acidimicrobiales bacterium]
MITLVVVPTYDEAETIETLLRGVRAAVPHADILVVDDASPDGTADTAEIVGKEIGGVEVLRRAGKGGLGSAYLDGFRHGLEQGAELLVEIDADLSHDPAALPELLSAAAHGAHLVIGSRYVPGGQITGWSRRRRWLSRWGNRYVAVALGLGLNDATAGYRVYRADALRRIGLDNIRSDGYGFQIEMTYRLVKDGGRVVEIPVTFADRRYGDSKMSSRIVLEALVLVTVWGVRDVVMLRRRSLS